MADHAKDIQGGQPEKTQARTLDPEVAAVRPISSVGMPVAGMVSSTRFSLDREVVVVSPD